MTRDHQFSVVVATDDDRDMLKVEGGGSWVVMHTIPPANVLQLLDDPAVAAQACRIAGVPAEVIDDVIKVEVRVKGIPQAPSDERWTVGTGRKLPAKRVSAVPHAIPAVSQVLRVRNHWRVVPRQQRRLDNPVARAGTLILIEPRNGRH